MMEWLTHLNPSRDAMLTMLHDNDKENHKYSASGSVSDRLLQKLLV